MWRYGIGMEKVLKWIYFACAILAFSMALFFDDAGFRSTCIWIGLLASIGIADIFLFKRIKRTKSTVSRKRDLLFLGCVLAISAILIIIGRQDFIKQKQAIIILLVLFGIFSILCIIGTVKLIRRPPIDEE